MKPTIIDIKDWSPGGRDLVTLAVRSGRDADLPFVELLASDERVAFMSAEESGALVEALIQHGAASAHGGAARCTEPDCVLCTLTAQLEQERARADELEDRLQRVLSGGVHPAGCNAHACAPDCTVVERPAWLVELRTAVSLLERKVERLEEACRKGSAACDKRFDGAVLESTDAELFDEVRLEVGNLHGCAGYHHGSAPGEAERSAKRLLAALQARLEQTARERDAAVEALRRKQP